MRNAAAAAQAVTEQPTSTTPAEATTPNAPRSYSVSLHAADGSVLRITGLRRKVGAQSYVVTGSPKGADGKRVNTRGMTTPHPSFDAAKAAVEKLAVEAGKLGWNRAARRAGYEAKPDAFASLPTPPKPAPVAATAGKKKK